MSWDSKTYEQYKAEVLAALQQNRNYRIHDVLGLPASYLDPEVFPPDAAFLDDAPFARVFMENPNHIGCHTLVASESAFAGTHALERDLIRLCAEEIMGAPEAGYDGYVASGGTEANLQAVWIYRNLFMEAYHSSAQQVGVLYSHDSHYSFYKAANVLQVIPIEVEVDDSTRQMTPENYAKAIIRAQAAGVRQLVAVFNMGTTMFGSVDDIEALLPILKASGMPYRVHIDGAFGGFVYPFTAKNNPLTFVNPEVGSITIDAHKMLQAPYGTGIFLARKGLMNYAHTNHASYVQGGDSTLCGSRSGANLVAAWMILQHHGRSGWEQKIETLVKRTDRICVLLDRFQVPYFRNPAMNMVTMRAEGIPKQLAEAFLLVPDTHDQANWYKIVVMDHVTDAKLDAFISAFEAELLVANV
jgi:glutamate/tyrosine decarboxylase-like PLP-dependent enzyme